MPTTNELMRELSELKDVVRKLQADNVARPSRLPPPGGGGGDSVRHYRVIEIPSDDAIWLFAERVVRGENYGDSAHADYGRWIGISERDGSTIEDTKQQINIDPHLRASDYAAFIRNWGPSDVTTLATPILKAFRDNGAWHLWHPFLGVPAFEFSGDVEINDCVIQGVS